MISEVKGSGVTGRQGTSSEGIKKRGVMKDTLSAAPAPHAVLPLMWVVQSGGAQPSSQWQRLLLSQT